MAVALHAFIVLSAAVFSTPGFLLDEDCPAPAPCICTPSHVECQLKNLQNIPTFRNSSVSLPRTLILNFSGNAISGIAANTFSLLSTINAYGNGIVLELGNNNLTEAGIDPNAFNGIENMIHSLNLSDNRLTSVPMVISKLKNLKELYLAANPISTIDTQMFISTGHQIQRLSLPMAFISSWPEALHHLTTLQYLKLIGLRFILPFDAFKGFSGTLKQLIFQEAEFQYPPPPICSLKALVKLNITYDGSLAPKTTFHCNPGLSTVKTVMLNADSIDHFPDLFKTFPKVDDIFINNSKIAYIDDALVTATNVLFKRLTVSNSQLYSIPWIIKYFTRMTFLDLHGNNIRTVEGNDIGSLTYLVHLDLRNNPIIFISNTAFSGLYLQHVDLRHTLITAIPQAIRPLTTLKWVDLRSVPIACNCDATWLKTWAASKKTIIDGKCETSLEPIWNFMNRTLPQCP